MVEEPEAGSMVRRDLRANLVAPRWVRIALPIAAMLVAIGFGIVAIGGPSSDAEFVVAPTTDRPPSLEPSTPSAGSTQLVFTQTSTATRSATAPATPSTETVPTTTTTTTDPAARPNPPAVESTTLSPSTAAPDLVEPARDPRYPTCEAANAAGYGDYVEGVDVEYDWYQDADGDGVVCETRQSPELSPAR